MNKIRIVSTLVVTALLASVQPASAQAVSSPVPPGLAEGQGAPFPKGNYAALDALPDWGGIWFVKRDLDAPPTPQPQPQPKLKGEYLTQWQQWRDEVVANDGVERRSRSNCSPPGLPRIMMLAQYPYEFLFTPGRVTINQEAWMQTRTIWTDGREHPEDMDQTFHGHSIGHWEGDTLVVDTIGISEELEIGEGGRHSDKFRLVERIRLLDDDTLVNEMTMTDPEALEEPFLARTTYRRDRYGTLIEFQCSENDRNPVNADGETLYH